MSQTIELGALGRIESTDVASRVKASRVQSASESVVEFGHALELLPGKETARIRIRFTGSGSEYFRIWIHSLLLTVCTLGIYLPWARVRRLNYFYSHTRVGGHVLGFHGESKQMLSGWLVVSAFLAAYFALSAWSMWAAVIAVAAFSAIWPLLWWSSMRFRLANTSWRGMRFHFSGSRQGAWLAVGVPTALLLIPLVLAQAVYLDGVSFNSSNPNATDVATAILAFFKVAGSVVAIWLLALPYFMHRIKVYQLGNYRLGGLTMGVLPTPTQAYAIMFKAIGLVFAIAFVAFLIGAGTAKGREALILLIGVACLLVVIIWPRAYIVASLQNLYWSGSSSRLVRPQSYLSAFELAGLFLKNLVLGVFTLGLYWPFAAIETWRLRVESMHWKSRAEVEALIDAIAQGETEPASHRAD